MVCFLLRVQQGRVEMQISRSWRISVWYQIDTLGRGMLYLLPVCLTRREGKGGGVNRHKAVLIKG